MDKIDNAFHTAYEAEAKAVLRLNIYAEQALKEGYPQIAKLFRAIAQSEEIHGGRSLRMLKQIGNTEENLKASFDSETKIASVAYNEFIGLAISAGNKGAERIFSQIRDVEDTHAKLYKEAMNDMMEDRDTTYYICKVCGYTAQHEAPEECPVCNVPQDNFFEAE